ncbi:hypothetical protein [Ramlibacter sp. AN1133]|uniref:hypothetical protein n=1 Tax=Ramlibacter sp. AN1133 TaxID=3133429 RepID=UPI0030C20664
MKKTSLTRALCVAGLMAAAAGMAQADAIFYPDGTHVELGANAVENGLADAVLARSSTTAPSQDDLLAMGVLADQNGTMIASSDDYPIDTTTLGAGPARMTTTTVTTTTPVYVFPNINFDRSTVLASPHPMLSHVRSMEMDRTAAATFDTPTRAGEASTMTSGAPNLVTTNESVATVPPGLVDTTSLGAGPSTMSSSTWYGTTTYGMNNSVNLGGGNTLGSNDCGSNMSCNYLPD